MSKKLSNRIYLLSVTTALALLPVAGYGAVYEAEDAVVSGPVISSGKSGYTGSGYVDYQASSGDYVEWTVTAGSSVDLDIYFRYALDASSGRPLEIQVNGQVVDPGLAFPPTGGWKNWTFTAPLTVTLNAGANTVRATAIGSSGGNIDHLQILDPGPPVDPANLIVTAGDVDVLLEWDENVEADLAGYNVYRSTTPGSYGAPYATGVAVNEFLDQNVVSNMTYYYVVTAVDADTNESDISNEDSGILQPYVYYSLKKGNGMSWRRRVERLKSSWYYSWGMNPDPYINPAIEFIPMKYSKSWPSLSNLSNSGDFSALLAYNEPEKVGQGDTTVAEAIAQWPELELAAADYGALLGSPAAVNYNATWIVDFMTQAEANSYTVDFMCVHWYKGPSADQLMSNLQWVYDTWGRPIWITEMNVADWSAPNDYTIYQSYNFWVEALYRMESTDYVERYAVYPWDGDTSNSEASPFFAPYTDYTEMTPLGHLYAEYRSADTNGPYLQTWYHLHNESSRMRLYDNGITPSVADIYTENDATMFELTDAGNGNVYIVSKTSGLNLQCTGNAVVWSSATDASAQWTWTQAEHCWLYIDNAAYAKRLSSDSTGTPIGTSGTLSVANASTTDTSVRWAFVRTPEVYPAPTEGDPPIPSPATFAVAPAADSAYAISMTSTTGTDASGPVEYLFTETSVNSGGDSSGWQTSSSYTDDGLLPDTQYSYTVTMRDAYGNIGAPSSPANATTLSASSAQQATIVGSTFGAEQTGSNEAINSYDGNEASRWTNDNTLPNAWIEYDLGSVQNVTQLQLLLYNGDTRTYPISIEVDGVEVYNGSTGLTAGYWSVTFPPTSGRYVRLTMTGNNSSGTAWFSIYETQIWVSAADTTPPAAPTALVATAGDGSVTLDWADNGEPDLMHYDVYRSIASGSGYVSIYSGQTTSDYVDSSVTNGITYYYVVTAADTSGNKSGYSNEDSAEPNSPVMPAPVLDMAMSGSDMTVIWPSNYMGWILGYKTNLLETNGWTVLPGSESTNTFNAGSMTDDSVFFRLMSP